jgi:signal transduction histidine kinase
MAMSDQSVISKNLARDSNSKADSVKAQAVDKDQRLSIIFEVAKILVTEHNQETMLTKLFSCLIETLDVAEAGILLLYDSSQKWLTVKAAYGYDLTALRQLRLAPAEIASDTIFQTGRTESYPTSEAIVAVRKNMTPANSELLSVAIVGERHPQSVICIPLITGQMKVGLLLLENRRQPNSFVQADLTFLQAEVDLVALVIENVHLKRELQTAYSLREANRLKAELISTLAHEMRTPLTSIKGYSTALLSNEVPLSPETEREFLHIIDEECDILQDLIRDLLESSIIEAGLLRLELQPVILPRLVKSVIADFAHRGEKHHFLTDFPKRLPIVDADPNRIAQVLRNLLSNAVKYSPQGGLVMVRGEVHADEVVISVADQGIGIVPEHLNQLFDRFFRAESGLSPHVTGSGLGLPIARTIVESHKGRIWAESQVGQGSTFYFTIPLGGLSQGLRT